jgi:hypothetical protein
MRPAQPSRDDTLLARMGVANTSARVAIGAVVSFLVAAAVSVDGFGAGLLATKGWVIRSFDWLFVATASFAIVAVAVLALHPLARQRLGPDHARPEFGTLTWFAMLFSAGLREVACRALRLPSRSYAPKARRSAKKSAAQPTVSEARACTNRLPVGTM